VGVSVGGNVGEGDGVAVSVEVGLGGGVLVGVGDGNAVYVGVSSVGVAVGSTGTTVAVGVGAISFAVSGLMTMAYRPQNTHTINKASTPRMVFRFLVMFPFSPHYSLSLLTMLLEKVVLQPLQPPYSAAHMS